MVLYDPHKKPSEQKYPILIFCEVITYELEEQDGYAVPKDHRLIQLDVYDYSRKGIWEKLNERGYYSNKWKLMIYWQPEPIQEQDCPF